MRIAHISDLHVARPPSVNEYNAKRFLGYVNYRLFRSMLYTEAVAREALAKMLEFPPELVLLTGDITQHGLDNEFEAAIDLLEPVIKLNIPILAVPGNHDIYGQTENPALEALVRLLAKPLVPGENGLIHHGTVEILPLFQGIPTPLFCSHGRQNPLELERVHKAWDKPPEGVMRLVIGHYPVIDPHGDKLLRFRGLRESELLVRFCAEHYVSGYFCGHNHKRFAAPMPGGCMQYAAPALSSVRHAAKEWVSIYQCEPGMDYPKEIQF